MQEYLASRCSKCLEERYKEKIKWLGTRYFDHQVQGLGQRRLGTQCGALAGASISQAPVASYGYNSIQNHGMARVYLVLYRRVYYIADMLAVIDMTTYLIDRYTEHACAWGWR